MKTEINKTVNILKAGGSILYPTDTVWGIGCDATNAHAVKKIYSLKKRADSKALICLVSGIEMLESYVKEIPPKALQLISETTTPLTVIYQDPVGIAGNLVAGDNSIGIRIPHDVFCRELIKTFGKPIVSTSANISGQPAPRSYKEISEAILKGVDYVVNLYHNKTGNQPSSVIKIEKDGSSTVIRK